ncbi:hypothetical protein Tco_0098745 [Tanacetum coccineum]
MLYLAGLSRRYFLGDDVYPIFLHDDGREMDLFNLIIAQNPAMIKTGTRPCAAHEVPLLTVIASLQIDMEEPVTTSESSRACSTIERAEDQGLEIMDSIVPPAGPLLTTGVAPNIVEEEGTAADAPLMSKRHRKRANEESNVNAPRKVLRKDFDISPPMQSTVEGKSFASIRLGASSTISAPTSQETLAGAPELDPSSPTIILSPRDIYQPEWGVTNGCRLDTLSSCQELVDHLAPPEYFSKLRHLPNEEFLGEFNMNLAWQVAMGSQLRLRFEQEAKILRKSVTQVARRDQRIQAMEGEKKNLETLLEAEADMRRAAEAKNADLAKEMESLRAQFTELQVSRDGLSHQVLTLQAQGEEKLDLAMVEGYDPKAEGKFIATMQALKDLKYPLIDELEKLRDSPMDVLMASLYLESNTRTDTPQWIRDLSPSSSQLKISVYPEGLAILLADAVTQTDVLEEESSPKLTRSKSLPSM